MRNRYSVYAYLGLFAALSAACKGGTDLPAPVATTVSISPSAALTLASVGATQPLTAAVLDQRGDTMPALTVTWSSSNLAAATVSAAGVVTAVANGTATITATSGTISGTVITTVAQVPTTIAKNAGDTQAGTVAAALAQSIAVRLTDAGSNPVAGVNVVFAVATGGGNVASATVATNATGVASTGWTLGQTAGFQTVTATAGTLAPVTFSATGIAGAAAAIAIQSGNNQIATVGTVLPIAPQVRVTDSFSNPKASANVTFTVTGGAGGLTGATPNTDVSGNATLGSWTLGAAAGANTISATVSGTAIATSFTATGQAAGAPTNIAIFVGNNESGAVGVTTNVRPAARVTDNAGQPVTGVSVTFAIGSGGGSIVGSATRITNANGIAQVDGWALGAGAGANTLTATAAPGGILNNPLTFNATGVTPAFSITLRYLTTLTANQQAAFDSAAARWSRAIIGDLPDVTLNQASALCGTNAPAINEIVDDVLILVTVEPIDGAGGVLGSAGPCNPFRAGPTTIWGRMRFDDADLANLEASGRLLGTIQHEMGHVLGFGTLWSSWGVLVNTASAVGGDAHFTGVEGRAAFDSIGGTSYTGCPGFCGFGLKVPVENQFGAGTADGHWRESVFDEELMTGFIESAGTFMPVSLLTVASLKDLGFVVSFAAAEPLSQPYTMRAAFGGARANLGWDVVEAPDHFVIVDRAGRVVRVIQGRR